jgi:ABC-type lipoprotein export system ATPase subunit
MTEDIVKSSNYETPKDTKPENILLEAKGLFAIYRGLEGAENVVALRGLDMKIHKREFVSVVGTSGAGKSTLLRILGGLQRPSAGTLKYLGQNITNLSEDLLVPFRRNSIGFIFQEGNLLAEHTAYENVLKTLRYAGVSYNAAVKRVKEVLHQLGMTSRMHARPHHLSGGELQRVAIARALANKPQLILADEPTGNLDHENTDHVMGLLKDLHDEMDASILIVTHSPHVASFSNRNIELSDGKIVGHHDAGSNIYALEESRAVIVSETGNLTLPPEIMPAIDQYGNMWNFRFENLNENPRIVATPKSAFSGICPVCNVSYKTKSSFCSKCGARLQK